MIEKNNYLYILIILNSCAILVNKILIVKKKTNILLVASLNFVN